METTARVHQSKASSRHRSSRARRSATPQRLEQLEQTEVRGVDDGATQSAADQELAVASGSKNRSSTLVRSVRRPDTPEHSGGSTTTNASSSATGTSVPTQHYHYSASGDSGPARMSQTPRSNSPAMVTTELDAPVSVDGTVEVVAVDLVSGLASLGTVPGPTDDKLQKGILGYMDRQLKVQSLSDPQKSPAQRSTRSRSSLEKSPRRKRSKSESRRRRERKILAAGEMEVRQANETLMRYLKQCSDFNDASLSGDLEIPEHLEDRRVHRKTKSQRERKLHQLQPDRSGGRTNADDLMSYHGEIYNPFTPVVSPTTEAAATRIDKMYIQTASGYRPVDNTYSYHKSRALIGGDPESNSHTINTSVHLSCAVQRVWHLLSTVCHGLLGGLAFAHLLLICTTKPYDWVDASIRHYSAFAEVYANTFYCLAIVCMVSIFDRMDIAYGGDTNISFRSIFIIMIYVMTIILSLSAGTMDERLYVTSTLNVTVWEEELETNKVLSIWNALSIAQSVGAIFGWLIVGFLPNQDNLYDQLLEMEKYQLQ
ncbi:uncharacterized protein LOC126568106 [Anopheles maculipalpis]|uniref:uncharacterized protein LOC126568106 n=1 Tax=Anopheles maculipalpis TaxID=1496333 RepID=UPI0021593915|nr:uncharacterized protein LOC126568106 [Anopheles maculipalpis]